MTCLWIMFKVKCVLQLALEERLKNSQRHRRHYGQDFEVVVRRNEPSTQDLPETVQLGGIQCQIQGFYREEACRKEEGRRGELRRVPSWEEKYEG